MKDKTIGTPYGSTAHYHMLYTRNCSRNLISNSSTAMRTVRTRYDAGTIDGAFVWGGVMEKMKEERNDARPAKLLSDWEKATFNTISVRDDFAADHSEVVERIAGVVARLDADYLKRCLKMRTHALGSPGHDRLPGFGCIKLLPGDFGGHRCRPSARRQRRHWRVFEFVDPTDEDEGWYCILVAQTGCTAPPRLCARPRTSSMTSATSLLSRQPTEMTSTRCTWTRRPPSSSRPALPWASTSWR